MTMKKECELCDDSKEDVLFQTDHWNVCLAWKQNYLGRCIVILREHVPSLSELSAEQWADLNVVIQRTEAMIKAVLHPDPINWSCLMNHAYQTKPHTPHVHWHVLPRYEKPVTFGGYTFTDAKFGYMYESKEEVTLPADLQKKLGDALRDAARTA